MGRKFQRGAERAAFTAALKELRAGGSPVVQYGGKPYRLLPVADADAEANWPWFFVVYRGRLRLFQGPGVRHPADGGQAAGDVQGRIESRWFKPKHMLARAAEVPS